MGEPGNAHSRPLDDLEKVARSACGKLCSLTTAALQPKVRVLAEERRLKEASLGLDHRVDRNG